MSTEFFVGREIELNNIIGELKKSHNDESKKRIINVFGIGGIGKTTLIEKVLEKLKKDKIEMIIFKINEEDFKIEDAPNRTTICEFVNSIPKTFNSNYIQKTKASFEALEEEIIKYYQISGQMESKILPEEKKELGDIRNNQVKAAKCKGGRKFKFPAPDFKVLKVAELKIDLGEMQGKEIDGKEAAKVYEQIYNEAKERILKERYKTPEDQEFLIKPELRITAAFFSGLNDSIFPPKKIIGIKINNFNVDKKPIKVLFVFDTYERLDETVNEWLLEHLIPGLQQRVNDFDYRFIISGRKQLKLTDSLTRWDRYADSILEKDIQVFSKDEIKLYLPKRNIDLNRLEEAIDQTDGLAYLLDIWCSCLGESNALLYSKAADRIFWWKNDDQKKWIKGAAFLDYYDKDSLAIFFGDNSQEAYDWLRECHEVTRANKLNSLKFQIHTIVKRVINEFVKQESPTEYNNYIEKSKIYYKTINNYKDPGEREKLCCLCVFKHFSQPILEDIFKDEDIFENNEVFKKKPFELHNFADEHPEYFDRENTFKMKDDIKEDFMKYVSWAYPTIYKRIKEKIDSSWKRKNDELNNKLEKLNIEKNKLEENKLKLEIMSSQNENGKDKLNEKELIPDKNHKKAIEKSKIASMTILKYFMLVLSILLMGTSLIFELATKKLIFIFGGICFLIGLILIIFDSMKKKDQIQSQVKLGSENNKHLDNFESERKKIEGERIKLRILLSDTDKKIETNKKIISEIVQELNESYI